MITSSIQWIGLTKPGASSEKRATPRADCSPRPLHRPGAGAADDAESLSAPAKRRAAHRRSRPDGASDSQAGVRRRGSNREDASASAAATRCPRAQAHAHSAARVAGTNPTAPPINSARRLTSGLGQQTDAATSLRVSAILLQVNIASSRYGHTP
jgi:hypothetical protein